jgi:Flp pilus assembly pilin Flp
MSRVVDRLRFAYFMMARRIDRPERGASMTEYAILVAVMAGVVVVVVTMLGSKISVLISNINITT